MCAALTFVNHDFNMCNASSDFIDVFDIVFCWRTFQFLLSIPFDTLLIIQLILDLLGNKTGECFNYSFIEKYL